MASVTVSCLCVCVGTLKGKPLELATPKVVDIQCVTVAWHALTLRLKGQRSRSHGYQIRCWRVYARRYDCLGFYSFFSIVVHFYKLYGFYSLYILFLQFLYQLFL